MRTNIKIRGYVNTDILGIRNRVNGLFVHGKNSYSGQSYEIRLW